MCACVCMCVCIYVYVCVYVRECMCVCVCACVFFMCCEICCQSPTKTEFSLPPFSPPKSIFFFYRFCVGHCSMQQCRARLCWPTLSLRGSALCCSCGRLSHCCSISRQCTHLCDTWCCSLPCGCGWSIRIRWMTRRCR